MCWVTEHLEQLRREQRPGSERPGIQLPIGPPPKPKAKPVDGGFESMTMPELKATARDKGLSGYSKLNKAGLISLLETNG